MKASTVGLKEMITHYKDNGERVDEVLFQEVMKFIETNDGMSIIDIRLQFIDLHRNYLKLKNENKRLTEASEVIK